MAEACPACSSPDTVGYWDKPTDSSSSVDYIYKSIYPSARRCIDCGLVWWTEEQRVDVASLRARGDESILMPCPPCPECGHLHRLSACGLCNCQNKGWRA